MVNGLLDYMARGAESIIYTGYFLGKKIIVKHRISKPYRNKLFDKLFRYHRTRIEAKILSQLYINGVNVPAPLLVDLDKYVIVMEYIEGDRFSKLVNVLSRETILKHARVLGKQVGIMHSLDIYHGDLTLANILIDKEDKLYLIDFGLAGYSRDIEEYAIDLHLLRRNLTALAPELVHEFLEEFLKGYSSTFRKNYSAVIERMEEIRLRGRYVEERLKKRLSEEKYVGE